MRRNPTPTLPAAALALDLGGVGLLVLGILGLTAGEGTSLGALAEPALAWALVVGGGVLLAVAAFLLVLHFKGGR